MRDFVRQKFPSLRSINWSSFKPKVVPPASTAEAASRAPYVEPLPPPPKFDDIARESKGRSQPSEINFPKYFLNFFFFKIRCVAIT